MGTKKVEIAGFDRVQAMISAHVDLLMQHYIYLNKIKSTKVPEDEIGEYLKDILGLHVPNNGKFKTEYLPALLGSLKTKLDIFLKFKEILQHPNQEIAMSTLSLLLHLELAYAQHASKISGNNNIYLKDKMQTILGSSDYIKAFLKSIKSLLPESHEKLSNIIYYKCDTKSKYKKTSHSMHMTFSASWTCNWQQITFETEKLVTSLKKDIESKEDIKRPKNQQENSNTHAHIGESIRLEKFRAADNRFKILSQLPDIFNKVNERIEKNYKFDFSTMTAYCDYILQNVEFFYEINPLISNANKVILSFKEDVLNLNVLKKSYDAGKADVKAKCRIANNSSDLLRHSIKNACQNPKFKNHTHDLNKLSDELSQIQPDINQLSTIFSEDMKINCSQTLIDRYLLESKNKNFEIKSKLKKIEASFLSVLDNAQPSPEKNSPQPSLDIRSADQNIERTVFLNERERINRAYKESVKHYRLEKEKLKKTRISESEKQNDQPEATIVYKNLDVEELLLSMNEQHFNLLQDLFSYKKGIRYSEICNLITSQLHGEVEEIGGGSSHKRIRIAKYFVEVASHEQAAKIQKTKSSSVVAVGGMFRPHGGAHQSGGMSRFNMQLVVNTFIKAGITQEVLNQFQEQRLSKTGCKQ